MSILRRSSEPIPVPRRFSCKHELARQDSLTCPDCSGILRRCCDSALGALHRSGCLEDVRREAAAAMRTETEGGEG